MAKSSEIEIPFEWTCPIKSCNHKQTDTVNPDLGPFITAICGECGFVADQSTMYPEDWQRFDDAVEAAFAAAGYDSDGERIQTPDNTQEVSQ